MKKSIGQRAVDFAGDRSQGGGHGYPSWEANLIEKGYVKGAKDQEKLMFTKKDLERAFKNGFTISYGIQDINSIDRKDELFREWFTQIHKTPLINSCKCSRPSPGDFSSNCRNCNNMVNDEFNHSLDSLKQAIENKYPAPNEENRGC
jgi:hypothetical protein